MANKENKKTKESITPSEFGMEVTSIIFNRTSGWPTKLEQAIQAHNKAERERVLEEVIARGKKIQGIQKHDNGVHCTCLNALVYTLEVGMESEDVVKERYRKLNQLKEQ